MSISSARIRRAAASSDRARMMVKWSNAAMTRRADLAAVLGAGAIAEHLEAGAVVALEQLGDQVAHRVAAEIRGQVAERGCGRGGSRAAGLRRSGAGGVLRAIQAAAIACCTATWSVSASAAERAALGEQVLARQAGDRLGQHRPVGTSSGGCAANAASRRAASGRSAGWRAGLARRRPAGRAAPAGGRAG